MRQTFNAVEPSAPLHAPRRPARWPATLLAALATQATGTATGGELAPPDKSAYTLFNPTPVEFMRGLETDRPDKTESPYSVDAGHFQLEMDLFTFTRQEEAGSGMAQRAWSLAPLNLKLGLLNNLDLQLVIEPYLHVRTESLTSGQVTTQAGFGDTSLRAKVNLWGNDGGPTALAALPFVTFPTSQQGLGVGAVQGGLALPFAFDLPLDFGGGAQTGFAVVRNGTGAGCQVEFASSVTVNRSLTKQFSAYVEFWSLVSTEAGADWQGTFDFGGNFLVTPNLKLDAGVNLGVTSSADDWMPFVGLTWRY